MPRESRNRPSSRPALRLASILLAFAAIVATIGGLGIQPAAADHDRHPGTNGEHVDDPPENGDVKRASAPLSPMACYTGCYALGALLTFALGPEVGLPAGAVCASGCIISEATNSVEQNRSSKGYVQARALVDPRSTKTARDVYSSINNFVGKQNLTSGMASDLTNAIRILGTGTEHLIPDGCFDEQNRFRSALGRCAAWTEAYNASRTMTTWTVKANASDTSTAPRPARGHFTCKANGLRYYSNGTTAYRQVIENGWTKCSGVVLDLHVYRDGRVIQVIKGDSSSGDSSRPAQGHFTCKGNGLRYYSNGSTAYRQIIENGWTRCPGVTLSLHVYKDGKVIKVLSP